MASSLTMAYGGGFAVRSGPPLEHFPVILEGGTTVDAFWASFH